MINAGISGNRVRRDVIGASALGRFDRDVLARAGVRWLVLFEGINDITFSALPAVPDTQRTTADELIETLEQIVDRAHARGIKVMGGTLMPMGGLWLHNAETEAMRQAVNEWIRTSGKLDAVADFDAATATRINRRGCSRSSTAAITSIRTTRAMPRWQTPSTRRYSPAKANARDGLATRSARANWRERNCSRGPAFVIASVRRVAARVVRVARIRA